jgi:hypothetical protein
MQEIGASGMKSTMNSDATSSVQASNTSSMTAGEVSKGASADKNNYENFIKQNYRIFGLMSFSILYDWIFYGVNIFVTMTGIKLPRPMTDFFYYCAIYQPVVLWFLFYQIRNLTVFTRRGHKKVIQAKRPVSSAT